MYAVVGENRRWIRLDEVNEMHVHGGRGGAMISRGRYKALARRPSKGKI